MHSLHENMVSKCQTIRLFIFQSQSDFYSGLASLREACDENDAQQIENECLGMAVMAISHHGIEKDISISVLPKNFE